VFWPIGAGVGGGGINVQDGARPTRRRRRGGRARVHDTATVGRSFAVGVERGRRTAAVRGRPPPESAPQSSAPRPSARPAAPRQRP